MAVLQLCVSQADNENAFEFKLTNVKVFSLEEALFHTFRHWKQTSDELFSDDFTEWVRGCLGLPAIAGKLRGYASLSFSDRFMSCMRVVDYFDDGEIKGLAAELDAWGKRVEWEKLKDRGDYLAGRGQPAKAIPVYRKALAEGRRVSLLNNLAVALMQAGRNAESAGLLREALGQEPGNEVLKLNYAEACVYSGNAREALNMLNGLPGSASAHRVFGEMYSRAGDMANALASFSAAADLSGSDEHVYRLAEHYVETSDFDGAERAIGRVRQPDARAALKLAGVFEAKGDFASASGVLEKALGSWPGDAGLWLGLAECKRRENDLESADRAAAKALSLSPGSPRAQLARIKIKRAQNRPREYQEALHALIGSLKDEYRAAEGAL